jgi:hypothetical protein
VRRNLDLDPPPLSCEPPAAQHLTCAAHSPTPPLLHSAFCTLRCCSCTYTCTAPTYRLFPLWSDSDPATSPPALSLLARSLARSAFFPLPQLTTTTLLHKVIRLDLHFACPRVPRLIVTRAFLVSRVVPVLLFGPEVEEINSAEACRGALDE